MKTVSATAWIDAPPMKVWAVLTDLRSYPEWNPGSAAGPDMHPGERREPAITQSG